MRCKKAKDFILDYQDLSDTDKRFLQEHLDSCPECSREFEDYKAALLLLLNSVSFKPPENYWQKFGLKLRSSSFFSDLKIGLQERLDYLLSLLRAPLLGPIPGYVFSLIVLAVAAVGFSSLFGSGRYPSHSLVNNLIISEGQLLSAKDDGLLTIYTVSQK